MRKRRVGLLAVLGVGAAFFVAGCGGGGGGGGGEQGSSEESGGPTATIVSDLPLQGSGRAQQQTVANAIELALEQRDNMAGDVQINYESQDDATAQDGKWTEAKCAENAQSAAQNEEIVGWIGPYNSGCAAVEIPILNQAGLAMVSHGNTAVGLTKPGGDPDEPEKYYPTGQRNYSRVIVADDKQGRAGAVWMRDEGVQSVYILDDRETYGKGIADQFEQNAQELSIQVLGHEGIDGTAPNYRALMQKIAQLNPDAIYFGGITDNNAAQLVNDKVGAGMPNENVIFMGPDGILEEAFVEAAGDAAEGVYATFAGLPSSELPDKGQEFVDQYEEKYGSGIEALTAYGYEAANVMLDAIQRAYENDGEVTRAGVVRELLATKDYNGVLGTWSFDENGDTTLTQLSGQRAENGKFEFSRTIDVGGT
jgi:branched-chain amino acid transport system substrate-binding protein